MKRHLSGTGVSVLFSCALALALVRFAFPATSLADGGKDSQKRLNYFYFGGPFRGNPAKIGETLDPPRPAWLYEHYFPLSSREQDIPSLYRRGPEENRLRSFVHNTMQSLLGACGIYALVGGIGSELANRLDSAAERAIWRSVRHSAKTPVDAKQSPSQNFRGY
jgi:hypothetical protein